MLAHDRQRLGAPGRLQDLSPSIETADGPRQQPDHVGTIVDDQHRAGHWFKARQRRRELLGPDRLAQVLRDAKLGGAARPRRHGAERDRQVRRVSDSAKRVERRPRLVG
jgi:hypothetical protein